MLMASLSQPNSPDRGMTASGAHHPGAPARTGGETRLLTIADVSAWLGVSKAWVYDHTTRKRPLLPYIRLGEMTRFKREDVEKFIEEHTRRPSGG